VAGLCSPRKYSSESPFSVSEFHPDSFANANLSSIIDSFANDILHRDLPTAYHHSAHGSRTIFNCIRVASYLQPLMTVCRQWGIARKSSLLPLRSYLIGRYARYSHGPQRLVKNLLRPRSPWRNCILAQENRGSISTTS
jgi:hypothetical protein